MEHAGKSSFLRPSCCGVTPWLIFLSNSSPESLFVWLAGCCRWATKASTRLSPSGSTLLALVNASGPQIEVRSGLPCCSVLDLCPGPHYDADTTVSISIRDFKTSRAEAAGSFIARRARSFESTGQHNNECCRFSPRGLAAFRAYCRTAENSTAYRLERP